MPNEKLLESVPVDLLYQALETEKGGVQIYSTALRCVINEDLKEEWNKYLEQTKTHVQVVTDILRELGLDPNGETAGRKVVRYIGTSLVKMELALRCAIPRQLRSWPPNAWCSRKRRTTSTGNCLANWSRTQTPQF
jgi:rubrerythrin